MGRFLETGQPYEVVDLTGNAQAEVRLTATLEEAEGGQTFCRDDLVREMMLPSTRGAFLDRARAQRTEISGYRVIEWGSGAARTWVTGSRLFVDAWVGVENLRVELLASMSLEKRVPGQWPERWLADIELGTLPLSWRS